MSQRVVVLGCGPTGLMAAHAATLNGWDVTVVSKKRKSFLFGSQYLHEPIPGVINYDEYENIKYTTIGTPEQYRRKCHGDAWDGEIAREDFEEDHLGWDIRRAYDKLWYMYGRDVVDHEITGDMQQVRSIRYLEDAELVVSSLPRTIWNIKLPGRRFVYSEGWACGDAPEKGMFVEQTTPCDNQIICDGTEETPWTRLSRVFGYTSIEWPDGDTPPHPNASKIKRPLRFEPGIGHDPSTFMMHVGRYGTWKKGVLVTDAFKEVFKVTE